jgi:uncharacterized membrane protein (UPF0127 family)
MKFILLLILISFVAKAMTCQEILKQLSPFQVYEWTKENADKVWDEAHDLKLPSAKRQALVIALAENDPERMAKNIGDSIKISKIE